MQTTTQWLSEKLDSYKENPEETLKDMLVNTNSVIERYFKNQSTIEVLDTYCTRNKLFFNEIEKIENSQMLVENCEHYQHDHCNCLGKYCQG